MDSSVASSTTRTLVPRIRTGLSTEQLDWSRWIHRHAGCVCVQIASSNSLRSLVLPDGASAQGDESGPRLVPSGTRRSGARTRYRPAKLEGRRPTFSSSSLTTLRLRRGGWRSWWRRCEMSSSKRAASWACRPAPPWDQVGRPTWRASPSPCGRSGNMCALGACAKPRYIGWLVVIDERGII